MKQIGKKSHILFQLIENDRSKDILSLNLYLGNRLISKEPIFIPTYVFAFQNLVDNVKEERFKNIKFEELSSEQVFKVLSEERNSDEPQFFRHLLQLDETIDQYTIFTFQKNKLIKFVWVCRDENNSEHQLNKIYSVQFQANELVSTVISLIEYLSPTKRSRYD